MPRRHFKTFLTVFALLAFNVLFYDIIVGSILDAYIQDALANRGCLVETIGPAE